MRKRLPSLLLAVLIAAPLLVFLPKLFGTRTPEPLDRRPTWAQLVVVTCGALPADLDLTGPGFTTLERRAASAAVHGVEDERSAAATLWTGRRTASHGVIRGGPALAAGTWTLTESARQSGAVTAALLEAPLVTSANLAGFDRVVEQGDLGPAHLAVLADEQLAAHPLERHVLWIHLADPGPRGAALDRLLTGLHEALDARGHRWDALVLVTPLGQADVAPLWAALPSALYAEREGRGTADLADVAGLLLQLLRIPGPDVTRLEAPIDSSPDLAALLQGGTNR